ncbi:uncharacterized protein SRS1_15008 [Sporisorium reilianum f. sp. reilianum]|uniref:Shq1 C-terminal domain-containing protein n=1 Tax=Sporisorium reilianum f. sp. reilianum TaxID=72559 RepID=A0A2N8UHD6_9BASI|nr:uncharacterized protein SRS1_15008 [Sporisorium reilianum f. sp. reilianum]
MDGFIIPDYKVSQDAHHVYIVLLCQSTAEAGAAMPNIAVEGRIFGLHFERYYLPLVLPGAVTRPASDAEALRIIEQDDSASSSSHGDRIVFRVTLNKLNRGEHLEGLERVEPQLLPEDQLQQALSDAEQSKGFFQQPGSDRTGNIDAGLSAGNNAAVDEAAKALLQQALRRQGLTTMNDDDGEAAMTPDGASQADDEYSTTDSYASSQSGDEHPSMRGPNYGIGWRGRFRGPLVPAGCTDTRKVLEIMEPHEIDAGKREVMAEAFEGMRWDEGIYMNDFIDIDDVVKYVLEYQPRIPPAVASSSSSSSGDLDVDVEALELILQLLFAYSYDDRTNEGDPTVESNWTLVQLSRSLAVSTQPGFPAGAPLEKVVSSTLIGCVRRALTVPLYRHWELTMTCIHDMLRRLDAGEAYVRSCLERIAARLEEEQDAVLCRLSKIWVAPLLAHMPSQAQLDALAACIRRVMARGDVVTKKRVGGELWDLEVLEQAAKESYDDGEGGFV